MSSDQISDLHHESSDGKSLFELVGEAGKQRYGTETARHIYEELALSIVSMKLKQAYGLEVNKVKMPRHTLLFGPSETFKSQMVSDFMEHLLPETVRTDQVDSSTPRALMGSVNKEECEVYTPAFSNNEIVQVEWDTLATMEQSGQIQGVFYKALEDNVIRNDMVSVAKSDIETDEYLSDGNKMRLEFDVESVIIGVVHLESQFWKEYDKAFYNRWWPVFNDPRSGYIAAARSNQERLDQDETEIKGGFKKLFDRIQLDGDFQTVNADVYRNEFTELYDQESPRIFNKTNVTLSCKALLEGRIEDGDIQPNAKDIKWLKSRIEDCYNPHYNEMWSFAETNQKNAQREKDKIRVQANILRYLLNNGKASRREIEGLFDRSDSTIRRYLSDEEGLLTDEITSHKEMTKYGKMPVYWLKEADD